MSSPLLWLALKYPPLVRGTSTEDTHDKCADITISTNHNPTLTSGFTRRLCCMCDAYPSWGGIEHRVASWMFVSCAVKDQRERYSKTVSLAVITVVVNRKTLSTKRVLAKRPILEKTFYRQTIRQLAGIKDIEFSERMGITCARAATMTRQMSTSNAQSQC